MFLKIWKKAKQLIKEEIQLKKDYRRLSESLLDYEALQNMVNTVANTNTVEIEIKTKEGHTFIIRKAEQSNNKYESFMDKYRRAKING